MRRAGFTLLELMAVVLLMGIVLTAVVDFYVDLTRASRAALERVRADRRAVAVLDRVARDLEGAVLVKKPADVDPLAHPWVFLATGEGDLGATQLKFASRSRLPRVSALRESDFEVVAYWLDEREDGSLDLVRWSHPHLPESLDRELPAPDDPGAAVLAHGVAAFGVRLRSDAGERVGTWDSSQIVESSELPVAAEISIELLPEDDQGTPLEVDPAAEAPLREVAVRTVLLPLRPLDLEKQLEADGAAGGDEEDDEEDGDEDEGDDEEELAGEDGDAPCMTVAQCISLNPAIFQGLDPGTQAAIQSLAGRCYRDVAGSLPPVPGCQ